MAQPVSIQIYSMLFSWRHSIYLSMLGCLLLVTTSFAGTSKEVRRFDHNQDGKPDQWEYYRNGVLLRGEVDRNHDGRVDEWTFYENGKKVRAEFDTDGDGKVDQWHRYREGVLSLVEQDTDCDGTVDRIIHFEGLGQIAQV
jgi:hypothetical protein